MEYDVISTLKCALRKNPAGRKSTLWPLTGLGSSNIATDGSTNSVIYRSDSTAPITIKSGEPVFKWGLGK